MVVLEGSPRAGGADHQQLAGPDHRDRRWRRLRRASLVTDLLGMNPSFRPKFVRPFMDGYAQMRGAFEGYVKAVKERSFPSAEESFSSPAAGGRQAVGDKVTRLY